MVHLQCPFTNQPAYFVLYGHECVTFWLLYSQSGFEWDFLVIFHIFALTLHFISVCFCCKWVSACGFFMVLSCQKWMDVSGGAVKSSHSHTHHGSNLQPSFVPQQSNNRNTCCTYTSPFFWDLSVLMQLFVPILICTGVDLFWDQSGYSLCSLTFDAD